MSKVRIVYVDPHIVQTLVTEGTQTKCLHGLPPGAKYIRQFYDGMGDRIGLVFEHESFEELGDKGSLIPEQIINLSE